LEVKEPNYQLARNNRDNSTDRILSKRTPGKNVTVSVIVQVKKTKAFHSYEPLYLKWCTPSQYKKKIKIRLVDIILEDATKLSLGTTIS